MSTPPVAPNLVTQEFLSLIWQKSYRNWGQSTETHPWLSNLYTQIHWDLFPSITQVSYPLQDSLLTSSTRTNRTSGVLQPTSDAQSRLGDFHQQATEEDKQWKHWCHQGGHKAHSGTVLNKEIWHQKIITKAPCVSLTDLVLFGSMFLQNKTAPYQHLEHSRQI